MSDVQPPDREAYGRVTQPERYAVLHEVCRGLIDELVKSYAVTTVQDVTVDPELVERSPEVETVIRIEPERDSAAPLTFAFTRFPGVVLRVGRWHLEPFPRCGCDACDEDPTELCREIGTVVDATVHGGFREHLSRGWTPTLAFALDGPGIGRSGASRISRKEARRLGRQATLRWEPWPIRRP